jgi:hypothetical protein
LGGHTATLYYCKLLKHKYDLSYIGIDEGNGYLNEEGIKSFHLEPTKDLIKKKIKYFLLVSKILKRNNFAFVLLNYFPLCSIFLFLNKNIAVEIRTSYIFKSKLKRFIYNIFLSFEILFFKHIITLSHSIKNFLSMPERTKIIPLGGPLIDNKYKDFTNLQFFEQFQVLVHD